MLECLNLLQMIYKNLNANRVNSTLLRTTTWRCACHKISADLSVSLSVLFLCLSVSLPLWASLSSLVFVISSSLCLPCPLLHPSVFVLLCLCMSLSHLSLFSIFVWLAVSASDSIKGGSHFICLTFLLIAWLMKHLERALACRGQDGY